MVRPVAVPSAADDLKLCYILLSAPPDDECAGEATLFDVPETVAVAIGADPLLFWSSLQVQPPMVRNLT